MANDLPRDDLTPLLQNETPHDTQEKISQPDAIEPANDVEQDKDKPPGVDQPQPGPSSAGLPEKGQNNMPPALESGNDHASATCGNDHFHNCFAISYAVILFFIGFLLIIAQHIPELNTYTFIIPFAVMSIYMAMSVLFMGLCFWYKGNEDVFSFNKSNDPEGTKVTQYLLSNVYVFCIGNFGLDMVNIANFAQCFHYSQRGAYLSSLMYHACKVVFVCCQLIFLQIFMKCSEVIKKKWIFKIGIAHLLATNFLIWFNTLSIETGILDGTLENHQDEHHILKCRGNYTRAIPVSAEKWSEGLAPFVLEYCLLSASLLYSIYPWSQIHATHNGTGKTEKQGDAKRNEKENGKPTVTAIEKKDAAPQTADDDFDETVAHIEKKDAAPQTADDDFGEIVVHREKKDAAPQTADDDYDETVVHIEKKDAAPQTADDDYDDFVVHIEKKDAAPQTADDDYDEIVVHIEKKEAASQTADDDYDETVVHIEKASAASQTADDDFDETVVHIEKASAAPQTADDFDETVVYRSNIGIIAGLPILFLILFPSWLLNEHREYVHHVLLQYWSHSLVMIVSVILAILVIFELRKYHERPKGPWRQFHADDYLLFTTQLVSFVPFLTALIMSCFSSGYLPFFIELKNPDQPNLTVADIDDMNNHIALLRASLALFSMFNLTQVFIQTAMILVARTYKRCIFPSKKNYEKKKRKSTARIRTYMFILLLTNLAFWIATSFIELQSSLWQTYYLAYTFWGPTAWLYITRLLYPLHIFYRFHATSMIAHFLLEFKK